MKLAVPLVLCAAFEWPTPCGAQAIDASVVNRARSVLRQGAAEKEPAARIEVAVALSLLPARDPAAELLPALARDKDHLVRAAALASIGELRDPRMAKVAKEALDDDVPEVVFAAARTLLRLKQPEGRAVLIEIVGKDEKAKSSFVRAKLRDAWRRMKTPRSALLFAAQTGAGFLPVPGLGEGVSALSGVLGDPDFSARATSLMMLAGDRTPEVRILMEQAFLDGEWSMRAAAVQITAMRGEKAWRSRLVPLFDDSSRKVRYRAAASYLRLSASSRK